MVKNFVSDSDENEDTFDDQVEDLELDDEF